MALNQQFKDLCERWRKKAKMYNNESDISEIFDKFFSLYVAYNALYAQAYSYLGEKSRSRGEDGYKAKGKFPDEEAATNSILEIIGASKFVDILENNETTRLALNQLRNVMDSNNFSICLDPVSGYPRLENDKRISDKKLLKSLNGRDSNKKGNAILQVIYQIRCNMFHGRKGIDPIQKDLLLPIITILEKVVDELYETLSKVS